MQQKNTTARVMSDCVLSAHSIYDETQVITAAHKVFKLNVDIYVAVSMEGKGVKMSVFTEPVMVQCPYF